MLEKLSLLAVLLLATLALTIGIHKPFNGHHDVNNQVYRQAALNYLTKDISEHKFGQLINGTFYTHHPPLLPLTLAISLAIFGDHTWSIRLVPIVFSISTLYVFYLLLRKFFSAKTSLIALLFWIITPMFLYFGKMADHEVITLFFVVSAIYTFVAKKIKLVLLSVFLAEWSGWPGYYLAGILALFMRSWTLIFLSIFNFSLFIFHLSILTGSPIGGGLVDIFLFRTGAKGSIGEVTEIYTLSDFIKQELSWTYHFFTPPQFLLTLLAATLTIFKRHFGLKEKVWFIFFFVAMIHVVLFRTGAHRHDYWLYYFLPFFSFGMAKCESFFPGKKLTLVIFITLLLFAFWKSQPFFWALQTRID